MKALTKKELATLKPQAELVAMDSIGKIEYWESVLSNFAPIKATAVTEYCLESLPTEDLFLGI